MKNQLAPFLEPFEETRRIQYREIESGGADLVKMDKDPTTLPFAEVLQFKTSYFLNPPNPPTEINFPLLENEDGIIFYNTQFYYVNKKTETIVPINPEIHSIAEQKALEKLKSSFSDMVDNSSRRSSNDEHTLITNTMKRSLERKGILYERNAHGADLVKTNKDYRPLKFKEVAQLLENPDGILFYRHNFYYVSKEIKKIQLIKPVLSSNPGQAKLDKEALDKLKESFVFMKANTRRTNNAEHTLIARTMGHALKRHTVRYCDSRADFNRLPNEYRKNNRLCQEQNLDIGGIHWRQGVGGAQRDLMWLLQRYCDVYRPFDRLPDFKTSLFRRSFTIYSLSLNREVDIFADGHLCTAFGSDFGIYRGREVSARHRERAAYRGWERETELVAVSRLIAEAKASVIEFSSDQDVENTDANPARGPA